MQIRIEMHKKTCLSGRFTGTHAHARTRTHTHTHAHARTRSHTLAHARTHNARTHARSLLCTSTHAHTKSMPSTSRCDPGTDQPTSCRGEKRHTHATLVRGTQAITPTSMILPLRSRRGTSAFFFPRPPLGVPGPPARGVPRPPSCCLAGMSLEASSSVACSSRRRNSSI